MFRFRIFGIKVSQFVNREDRYLHNTTIVTDASKSLTKLQHLMEENSNQNFDQLAHIINKAETRLNDLNNYYERFNFYGDKNTPNSKGVINSIKFLRSDFLKLLSADYQYIFDKKIQTKVIEFY